jgi:UDP-N-acetylglucosamine transferase subunit ALG13
MIFVTVGSSSPFDRLIRAVDEWAELRGRSDIFAQIGLSNYRPKHIEAVQKLDPAQFCDRVHAANLVVAHAGMGSIITALEIGRPIVVMPRRAHLGETRNDHQFATAKEFNNLQGIIVAFDEEELLLRLDQAETRAATTQIRSEASPQLISTIRTFIQTVGHRSLKKEKCG